MSTNATTTNRIAGKTLRFLFAPQLSGGLSPIKGLILSFVQIIAQFMASAQLIPANHRALRPQTAADARLGDVLALAYSNVRKPGTRMDQWSVFLAATGLMGLLTLMLFYTISSFLIGTAHASITITLSASPCSFTAWTSIFTATCTDDLAQQWITVLLEGTDPATMWWGPQMNFITTSLQTGMAAMFSTYSSAMLILAGFLVLYHLLVIIAGTAHEGKFGGRAMNQVWAPIRLVFAIGMLVPLGGATGFNSGQMMVTQVAKYGSGLASNVWMAFANTYSSTSYIVVPPLPPVTQVIRGMLRIMACQKGIDDEGTYYGTAMSTGPTWKIDDTGWYGTAATAKTMLRTWDYSSGPDDRVQAVCGYIELANPAYVPTGNAREFLTSANTVNATNGLRAVMLNAHKSAIDNAMTTGSPLEELSKVIWDMANSANTTATTISTADSLKLNTAINDYRTTLSTNLIAGITASGLNTIGMAQDAMARGWPSAGVWFNTIARANGYLFDLTQILPNVVSTMKKVLPEQQQLRVTNGLSIVDKILESLPSIANATSTPLVEEDQVKKANDFKAGKDSLDMYLSYLVKQMHAMLGTGGGNVADEVAIGSISNVANLDLGSANPLAELSQIGYRLIQTAIGASRLGDECRAAERSEMQRNEVETGMSFTTGTYNCGNNSGSFLIGASTGAMISAGVMLAFILPLIPFIRFLFGILTWVLAMFETVIAIPIVALAHIKMDGEGLAGPGGRTAYLLMLQLFLRPTLMIFGLILSLVLFNFMIVVLNEFFAGAIRSIEGGGPLAAVNGVIYAMLYGVMAYSFATASFKAIDMVPAQCLQWIGGPNSGVSGEAEGVARSVSGTASGIGNGVVQLESRAAANGRI